jgi:hypothetical protein
MIVLSKTYIIDNFIHDHPSHTFNTLFTGGKYFGLHANTCKGNE